MFWPLLHRNPHSALQIWRKICIINFAPSHSCFLNLLTLFKCDLRFEDVNLIFSTSKFNYKQYSPLVNSVRGCKYLYRGTCILTDNWNSSYHRMTKTYNYTFLLTEWIWGLTIYISGLIVKTKYLWSKLNDSPLLLLFPKFIRWLLSDKSSRNIQNLPSYVALMPFSPLGR